MLVGDVADKLIESATRLFYARGIITVASIPSLRQPGC